MSMNIFEKINDLILEAKSNNKSGIPIHPEMETKEQGEMAAAEKILKLFQKLQFGSSDQETVNDNRPEIPDDMIDPKFKTPPQKNQDKEFKKNKLAGWDEESDEKIEKEVETNDNNESENDPFDDFDYQNNEFGDEEDDNEDDNGDDFDNSQDDDETSESEKLKNKIKDAIDQLNDDDDNNQSGNGGDEYDDDSGANWGDDDDDDGESGQQGGEGGESGQRGGQQGGQQGEQQGEQQGGQQGGEGGEDAGKKLSAKKQRLEDLKKSLDSNNIKDFNDTIEDIKTITDAPDEKDDGIQPGGKKKSPSDESVKDDMTKAGMDKKSIDKTLKEKNTDTSEHYNNEELEELKQQVSDELERNCKAKGGSALSKVIADTSSKRKIDSSDWKKLLKLFLKKKSLQRGNTSNRNNEITFGNKNSLWRGAVLPKDGVPSKGAIQSINCFIDFSGSVNDNLVYHFLGEVINLCVDLKYTNVNVYGFSNTLSLPRTITKSDLMKDTNTQEDGIRHAVSQTWDYIISQGIAGGGDNFIDISEQINEIKRKSRDKNAVCLIFGDGEWYSIDGLEHIYNKRYFKDICFLTYYIGKPNSIYKRTIETLINKFGVDDEHLIISKAESIK